VAVSVEDGDGFSSSITLDHTSLPNVSAVKPAGGRPGMDDLLTVFDNRADGPGWPSTCRSASDGIPMREGGRRLCPHSMGCWVVPARALPARAATDAAGMSPGSGHGADAEPIPGRALRASALATVRRAVPSAARTARRSCAPW